MLTLTRTNGPSAALEPKNDPASAVTALGAMAPDKCGPPVTSSHVC